MQTPRPVLKEFKDFLAGEQRPVHGLSIHGPAVASAKNVAVDSVKATQAKRY
jgi:hypothetical protein